MLMSLPYSWRSAARGVMVRDFSPSNAHVHFAAGVDERMQREKDGFLYRLQKYTVDRCKELDIPYAFGTDAHGLHGI